MLETVLNAVLFGPACEEPEQVAVRDASGGSLTNRELAQRSLARAASLRSHLGTPTSSVRVAIVPGKDGWLDFAVDYFGTVAAGCTPVIISNRWTAREIEQAVRSARVCAAVGDDATSRLLPSWIERVPEALHNHGFDRIRLRDEGAPQDILFTSGSTGTSKPVATSLDRLIADWTQRSRRVRPTVLHAFDPATKAAVHGLLVRSRLAGFTPLALGSFSAEAFVDAVDRCRCSSAFVTCAMLRTVVAGDRPTLAGALGSLRAVYLAGEPADPYVITEFVERFPRVTVFVTYTLTEAGGWFFSFPWQADRPSCVGYAPPGCVVSIERDDVVLPEGYEGEVVLRGQADATPLRTRDRGFVDGEGRLHVTGRLDSVINVGGRKVDSEEVRRCLLRHPAVIDAVVGADRDRLLGWLPAADVILRCAVPVRELRAFAGEQLADYKIPRRIVTTIATADSLSRKLTLTVADQRREASCDGSA